MKKIGIDIGGTTIEYIIEENNSIIGRDSFLVDGMNKDELLTKIASVIDEHNTDGINIGISSPTAVDGKTGYCKGLSAIKDYGDFNLYDELKAKIKSNAFTLNATNDGNAALLGIVAKELEGKVDSALMIALGSGIGGALYIGGQIFPGVDNMAGELGYPMWSGDKSISIALSPVNNFKAMGNINGKELFEKYDSDESIKDSIDTWVKDLIKWIALLSFSINTQYIFFNGGACKNKKFQELVLNEYKDYMTRNNYDGLLTTELKFFSDNNSLYGALDLAKVNNGN